MTSQSTYSRQGLGSSQIAGNVISSDKADLRIIGRHPESGLPGDGVPFSLDIEVETYRNWTKVFFMPILASWGACPDAVVVVRSADIGRVWGTQRIRTAMMDNCRGQARLVFHRDFSPTPHQRVVFELYPDGVDVNNLSGNDLIERSPIMSLDIGQSEGQQSGVYAPPTQSWREFPAVKFSAGSTLGEVNTLLKRGLIVAGVGAGFYFLSPLLPGFRDGVQKMLPTSGDGGQ